MQRRVAPGSCVVVAEAGSSGCQKVFDAGKNAWKVPTWPGVEEVKPENCMLEVKPAGKKAESLVMIMLASLSGIAVIVERLEGATRAVVSYA